MSISICVLKWHDHRFFRRAWAHRKKKQYMNAYFVKKAYRWRAGLCWFFLQSLKMLPEYCVHLMHYDTLNLYVDSVKQTICMQAFIFNLSINNLFQHCYISLFRYTNFITTTIGIKNHQGTSVCHINNISLCFLSWKFKIQTHWI